MEYLMTILVVAIIVIIIVLMTKSGSGANSKSPAKIDYLESQKQTAQVFLDEINQNQKIPSIQTSLYLKKGEEAYLEDSVTLMETRSKTISNRGGGAIRVAKGVYIGGSQGVSRSYPELRDIDTGKFILTNKRIVFSGDSTTKEFQLDKIMEINVYYDGISITYQGKEKKPTFKGLDNVFMWVSLVRVIQSFNENKEYPPIDFNANYT
jgi:hypothetical protein